MHTWMLVHSGRACAHSARVGVNGFAKEGVGGRTPSAHTRTSRILRGFIREGKIELDDQGHKAQGNGIGERLANRRGAGQGSARCCMNQSSFTLPPQSRLCMSLPARCGEGGRVHGAKCLAVLAGVA